MKWFEKRWFIELHAHSKLIVLYIESTADDKGWSDISMKQLRVALKPLTDAEIRAAFKEVEPKLNISQDKKKVSIKGCNCVTEPLFKGEDLFTRFITEFNKTRNGKYKGIGKVKTQFVARIKDGYTVQEIIKALNNAMKDKHHIERNFSDLTPEFITRADKLEKYLNYSKKEQEVQKIKISM